jgi:hypothetical protein
MLTTYKVVGPEVHTKEGDLLLVSNAPARKVPLDLIRREPALEFCSVKLQKDIRAAIDLLDDPIGPVPFMGKELAPLDLQRPIVSED